MTNRTRVFSVIDILPSGIANVTAIARNFVAESLALGNSNFVILPVSITPYYYSGAPTEKNWYTVQVNFYNPSN